MPFNVITSLLGLPPAAGFLGELAVDTAKRLWPSQNRPRGGTQGGYQALDQGGSSGSTINVLRKREQIPAVMGMHRVTPAPVTPPWTVLVNGNDVDTYQLFALQGEHELSDVYVNDTPSGSFESEAVEVVTRNGTDSDTTISLLTENVFEEVLQEELSRFKFEAGSALNMQDQSSPANSKPRAHVHTTKGDADEIRVRLTFPNGLIRSGSTISSTAIRMRIRPKGSSTWRYIPEIRFRGQTTAVEHYDVRFKFEADPGGLTPANYENWTFPAVIFNKIYQQAVNVHTEEWEADPYFGSYESSGASGSSTQHYDAGDNICTFYLDPDDATNPWPIDANGYEIELTRGVAGYQLFLLNFGYYFDITNSGSGTWRLSNGAKSIPENSDMVWQSLSTVRDEYPGPAADKNWSLVAIRARNIRLESVSVLAKGVTPIYSGGNWTTEDDTSNPAAWARRLFTDGYSAYPMPDAVRADSDYQDWYDFCVTEGLEFNMVIEGGMTVDRLFALICDAGYAKPRNGATRGVWVDKDRSADAIAGIMTPVNSANLQISAAFPEFPQAFLVSWRDSTKDYNQAVERHRFRSGYSASTTGLKSQALVAPGKVTSAEVDEWADRKLAELVGRPIRFQAQMDWEMLKFKRGDVVGLAFDTEDIRRHAAVVRTKSIDAGNITGFTLWEPLHISLARPSIWDSADPWSEPDPWQMGVNVFIGLQHLDGDVSFHQIDGEANADALTLTTPIPDDADIDADCVVWSGPENGTHRRLIVESIEWQSGLEAVITAFDEAASIHP